MVYKTDPNQATSTPARIAVGQVRPRPPSPREALDKEIQDLTGAEKHQLIRAKRRRLIKAVDAPQAAILVQPISSVRPVTPPSPPRSPSPLLPDADASPPIVEVPSPAPSRSPSFVPAEPEAAPSPDRTRQTTPDPPDRSVRPDQASTSSTQAEPYLTIHANPFSKLSFFPIEPNSTIPKGLYQAFNLPADQGHYTEDPDDLTTVTILHLGQALGGVSRLLKHQETAPDQSGLIRELQAELRQIKSDHGCLQKENLELQTQHGRLEKENEQLQTDHHRLRAEHESMELEQEINSTFAQSLHVQLVEKQEEVRSLEAKASDLVIERTRLLQDRVEKAAKMEGLQNDVTRLTAGLLEKESEVGGTKAANRQLEEEIERLEAEAQTLLSDHRPAIISEYRRSAGLREEVLEEFSKGYAFAKSMVIKAGVNPITLGFSSDEDASDTEGGLSGAQDLPSPDPTEPPSSQNSPHM